MARNHSAKINVPVGVDTFVAGLEGLTRVNERIMSRPTVAGGRSYPPLYTTGVRYKHESRDVWRNADDVLGSGWGDCEDLSAYRAAELRISGEDTGATVGIYQSGPNRYHAVVMRGDGTMEDPSKALGMEQEQARMRAKRRPGRQPPPVLIGEDPRPDAAGITFEVARVPGQGWGRGGWKGVIRVPLGMKVLPGAAAATPAAMVTAGPTATTPAAAIQAAVNAATSAGSPLQTAMINTLSSVIPGGPVAAAILTSPEATKLLKQGAGAAVDAVKDGLGALKFW